MLQKIEFNRLKIFLFLELRLSFLGQSVMINVYMMHPYAVVVLT